MFQYGCDKYLISNQLTTVAVDKIRVTEEDELPNISVINDETIYLEKGYYHGVYVLLQFNNKVHVDSKYNQ